MRLMARRVAILAGLFASLIAQGCCFVGVCDYVLSADGIVLGADNKPVSNAQIAAKPFSDPRNVHYNKDFERRSGADGCFQLGGTVPPQTWAPLIVAAPGYKSVSQQVPGTGWLHLIITLVPQDSDKGDSKVLQVQDQGAATPFPQCRRACATACAK